MRTTSYISRGLTTNVVDHGFHLKPCVGNPFLHTTHDGTSTGYMEGFQSKGKMDPIARFRYNLLPDGYQTGFFARNVYGKYIHWFEISTITKMKTQAFGEEAIPLTGLTLIVVTFTFYQLARLLFYHPDVSLYNFMLYPSKQWVAGWRAFEPPTPNQRSVRYVHRSSEAFIYDSYRDMVALGLAANDTYLDTVRSLGKEKELLALPGERGYNDPSWAAIRDASAKAVLASSTAKGAHGAAAAAADGHHH